MQKVFLDIGAHTGETLAEVIRPQYGFDRIVCFEPSPQCFAALEAFAARDRRIELCRFGLSDADRQLRLYGSGLDSATTLQAETNADAGELVQLQEASAWVRENLDPDALIVAKLNCEGGEIAILLSWIDSGLMALFYSVMITFDIRNFPALRHQEGEIRRALRQLGIANTCFADDVMRGPSHARRIAHWLALFGLDQPVLPSLAEHRAAYGRPLARYARRRGTRHRAERWLKGRLGYGSLPGPVKTVLRRLKSGLGLSAEQG